MTDKTNADKLFARYLGRCKGGGLHCQGCGSINVEAIRLNPKEFIGTREGCEWQLVMMIACIDCKETVTMRYTKMDVDRGIKGESIGDMIPKKTNANRLFGWYQRRCEERKVQCRPCRSTNVKAIRIKPRKIEVCMACGRQLTPKQPPIELKFITVCVDCGEIKTNEYTKRQVDYMLERESIEG